MVSITNVWQIWKHTTRHRKLRMQHCKNIPYNQFLRHFRRPTSFSGLGSRQAEHAFLVYRRTPSNRLLISQSRICNIINIIMWGQLWGKVERTLESRRPSPLERFPLHWPKLSASDRKLSARVRLDCSCATVLLLQYLLLWPNAFTQVSG